MEHAALPAVLMTPIIKVGQIWLDQDPRQQGRTFTIMEVRKDGKVIVETNTGRQATIKLERFRRGGIRGYKLVTP